MVSASTLHRLGRRIAREAADARLLGAGTLRLCVSRANRSRECTLQLARVGPITVRPSESDWDSFRRIFAWGEYQLPHPEPRTSVRRRYEALIECGATPVIIDAGAYVGAASLWFKRAYPAAHIVAIESDSDSFDLLKRNLASTHGTTAVHAAVGAEPGFATVLLAEKSWANQVSRSEAGVPIISMNDAFARIPGGKPFLAKINVEGFESEIFSGHLEWLDKLCLLFIEPHDWLFPGRHTSRAFQEALGERDFHLFIVGPHLCYARL